MKANRLSCQAALSCKMTQTAKLISKLHRQHKSAKLWNVIRKNTKAKNNLKVVLVYTDWWSTSPLSLRIIDHLHSTLNTPESL